MPTELECGYCRHHILIDGVQVGGSVPCPQCGWMHILEPALPTSGGSTPALTPSHAPEVPLDPRYRKLYLAAPWPRVIRGLILARLATVITIMFTVGWLLSVGILIIATQSELLTLWRRLVQAFSIVHLLPLLLHLIGQGMAANTPQKYGGIVAAGSCQWAGVGTVAFVVLLVVGYPVLGVVTLTAMLVFAFGIWITFLATLGRRLDDSQLLTHASRYRSWYVVWMVISFIVTCAAIISLSGDRFLYWPYQFVGGIISLVLGCLYWRLLRTAILAIQRSAPISRRDESANGAA
jgi:hypothetical protein